MNAPFKTPIIADVHGQDTVSISDLKTNPSAVVAEARHRAVAVLSRNKPVAYVVSPQVWAAAMDAMEEILDIELFEERLAEKGQAVPVSLADL